MRVITSTDSPLRVDFLPQYAAPWSGRVGVTIAPGKRYPGIGGLWQRDLDLDLERLRDTFGASLLVPLCEWDELTRLGIGDLYERARAAGIAVEPFAIVDGGVPDSPEAILPIVNAILDAAEQGRTVVIHCRGGLGRSGTIAACVLIATGRPAAAAMAIVREARPGAIENEVQEEFVRRFAAEWQAGTLALSGE